MSENPTRNHIAASNGHYEDRVRDIGHRRRQNDDRASALAEARVNAEKDRRALCLKRWPGILAAIGALLAAYNDGAGEELLTMSEMPDSADPAVTIASRGSARNGLIVSVDDDALLVRPNPASDSATSLHGIARRIDCSRNDIATAAYLLQDWMDQL